MPPPPSSSQPSPDPGSRAGSAKDDAWADLELPDMFPEIVPERRAMPRAREAREARQNEEEEAAVDITPEPTPVLPAEESPSRPSQAAAAAPRSPHGNRVPLERKTADGIKPFTRFITRPETSVAATLAAERAMERNGPPLSANSGSSFGKLKSAGEESAYRPNRLQNVMEQAYAHSRLTWIDQLGKFGVTVLAVVVGLGIAAILYTFTKEVQRQNTPNLEAAQQVEILPPDSIRQAGIRKAFDAFLTATDAAGKLPWVLEPERVESRMQEFYVTRGLKDPSLREFSVSAPLRAAGEWWFKLELTAADGTLSTVLMKETSEGGRVDWENFVAFGSMPWDEFLKKKPKDSQSMRVRLRASSENTKAFPAAEWAAYEIVHRDQAASLKAYAKRASRHGQWLTSLTAGSDWQSANLYLRWVTPSGKPPAQPVVEITDLIRNNWLDSIERDPVSQTSPLATGAEAGKMPN